MDTLHGYQARILGLEGFTAWMLDDGGRLGADSGAWVNPFRSQSFCFLV